MAEYSASVDVKSVPRSIMEDAIVRVTDEVSGAGQIPAYAYTLVVSRTFEYTHPYDSNDYLEIDMSFQLKKGMQDDISMLPRSARVTYQKNYIWDHYDTNVSW